MRNGLPRSPAFAGFAPCTRARNAPTTSRLSMPNIRCDSIPRIASNQSIGLENAKIYQGAVRYRFLVSACAPQQIEALCLRVYELLAILSRNAMGGAVQPSTCLWVVESHANANVSRGYFCCARVDHAGCAHCGNFLLTRHGCSGAGSHTNVMSRKTA